MGSIFLCLLSSSSFCPSSIFRESLGHSLFPGRPFCPFHPGLPCYPGILGLRAGATSRRPSSGEGWMDRSTHHPSRGSSCCWRMSRDATPLGATAPPPRRLSSASPTHPPALPGLQSLAPGPSRGGGHHRTVCSLTPVWRRPHSGPGGRSFQSTSLVMGGSQI
jgi:hypothetical protein